MLDVVYISDELMIFISLLFLFSATGALFLSASNAKEWRQAHSASLPYEWGFFFGWLNLLFYAGLTALILIGVLIDEVDLLNKRNWVFVVALLFSTFGAASGYGILARNRFAWALCTLLTLNPVGWLVNYLYGKRRLGYLQGGYREFFDTFFQRYLSLSRQARVVSSSAFLWLVFVLFSWDLFSLSDYFYGDGALLKVILFPPTIGVVGYFVVTKLWR